MHRSIPPLFAALPATALFLAAAPCAAHAAVGDIGVVYHGDWPTDCVLQIYYEDGVTGGYNYCPVGVYEGVTYGTIDPSEGEAWCNIGSGGIAHVSDDYSRVRLDISFDPDACVTGGGLIIDDVWGDGTAARDFDVHQWSSDGSSGVDRALSRFGDWTSEGLVHRVHLGRPDFDLELEHYEFLVSFEHGVEKSHRSGSSEQTTTDATLSMNVPSFCDFYDGPVALRTPRGRYVSVADQTGAVASREDVGGNELFELRCQAGRQVRFTGPRGESLQKSGDQLVHSTSGRTSDDAYFVAYQDEGGDWYLDAVASGGWWREGDSGEGYALDLADAPSASVGSFRVEEHDPVRGFTLSTTTATSTYADSDSPIVAQLLLTDNTVTDWVQLDSPEDDFELGASGDYDVWFDASQVAGAEDVAALRIKNEGSDRWTPSALALTSIDDGATLLDADFSGELKVDQDCDAGLEDGCGPIATVGLDGAIQRQLQLAATTADVTYADTDGAVSARLVLSDGSSTDWERLNLPGDDFERGEMDHYLFAVDESRFSGGVVVEGVHLINASGDGWIPYEIALTAEAEAWWPLYAYLGGDFRVDDDCDDDVTDGCAPEVVVDTSGDLSAP